MIDGNGNHYTASDSYVDYYKNVQVVNKDVSTLLLRNNATYYNSDLNKKVDRQVAIDKYSLKNNLNAGHADEANTSNFSMTATLARKTDYGGYLPKDCSADASCDTVQWTKTTLFSLNAESADNADTNICPTGQFNMTGQVDVESGLGNVFVIALSGRFPSMQHYCAHDADWIYHAYKVDTPVNESWYLAPGGDYNNYENLVQVTKSQHTTSASKAVWFQTYNELENADVPGHIGYAPNATNSTNITNEYVNYTSGNSKHIDITLY